MADSKISALDAHTAPTSGDSLVIVDATSSPIATKKVDWEYIYALSNERTATGLLVYPSLEAQTTVANSPEDGQISATQATYNGITYTMTMAYNASEQVTSRVVTNDTNAITDTQTITYSGNQISTISAWVRT